MSNAREYWRSGKASWTKIYQKESHRSDSDSSDCVEDQPKRTPQTVNAVPRKYQYHDSLDAEHIRLLELLPGNRERPLVCQLRRVLLNACDEKYEAISYVWGPTDGSTWIEVVEDGHIETTPNLHSALLHLRRVDRTRVLWVDAICINQESNDERTAQVPFMCEIYRNAASTVCYLGNKHNTTRQMFHMLEDLSQEAKHAPTDSHVEHYLQALPSFITKLNIDPIESELRTKYLGDITIIAIAACKWWHRIWTAQEMLLSENVIFMIGRRTITWEKLCRAVDYGLRIQIWVPITEGFIVDHAIVPYLSMRALIARRQVEGHRQLQQSGTSRKHAEMPASYLLLLLTLCRHRGSTDPRDKIYAVLGLLRDTFSEAMAPGHPDNLAIRLDYHHPTVYVYRKTAETIISMLNNLDILGTCPKSTRRALPSWVTDWSIMSLTGSPLTLDSFGRDRVTHATNNTGASAVFPEDAVTMILSGHQLTSITSLVELLPIVENNTPEEFAYSEMPSIPMAAWLKNMGKVARGVKQGLTQMYDYMASITKIYSTLFAWAKFSAAEPVTNTTEDAESIFWQTICAGTYSSGGIEQTRTLYKAWFDAM
ncbi:HET domain-containing protein [Seiridium cupressi]